MGMFFLRRDRERLEKVDERTTRLEETTKSSHESFNKHINWCSKLQFFQLTLLIVSCGFLLRIVLKLQ